MHTRVAPKRTSSAAGIRVTEREGLGRGRGLLGGEGGVFYAVNFVLSVTAAVWKSACGTRATAEKARPVVYNDERAKKTRSSSAGVHPPSPRFCVMAATVVDSEAYITLFMHACKFPSRTVNGLLLGSVSDGGVSVQKALPLFHTPLGLAPMLEAALMLVRRLRTLAAVCLASLTHPCCTGRPTSTARRTRCKWWAITRPTSCATTWSSGRSARPLRRRSARSANMRRCCWCVPLPAFSAALTRPTWWLPRVSRSTVQRCIPQRTTCDSCLFSAARACRHQRYPSPLQHWRHWSSL